MPISTAWQKVILKLCLIWLGVLYLDSTYQVYPNREAYYRRVTTLFDQTLTTKKTYFVEQAMNTCIDDPWDYQPITSLCANTVWRKGLTTICGPPRGGVGNLRNVVVNCIRYAIEAGGDLVLPQLMKRDDNNIVILANGDRFTADMRNFSYIFDLDHAIESMKLACPQMAVLKSVDHLKELTSTAPFPEIQYIDPQQFFTELRDTYMIPQPEKWRELFETWLNVTVPYPSSGEWKAWVDINTPFLQWPQSYERNLSATLGRVVRFPAETRRLAATVYWELSQRFKFNVNPTTTGIPGNTFFGAHLRTSIDAFLAGWTPYDLQASSYTTQALSSNLSVIYASSDHPPDVARWAAQAWTDHRINVTSKNDLLKGDDLAALQALTWDQQALVDYDVLLKASQFGGIFDSSFSANIAVRRHVLSNVTDLVGGPQTWRDEFSSVYGPVGGGPANAGTYIFFETLWP